MSPNNLTESIESLHVETEKVAAAAAAAAEAANLKMDLHGSLPVWWWPSCTFQGESAENDVE